MKSKDEKPCAHAGTNGIRGLQWKHCPLSFAAQNALNWLKKHIGTTPNKNLIHKPRVSEQTFSGFEFPVLRLPQARAIESGVQNFGFLGVFGPTEPCHAQKPENSKHEKCISE